MPRGPRLLLARSYYHIMTRGNNTHTIFRFSTDYLFFLHCLTKYKTALPFRLFHYCLMPTHVHMLIQTEDAADFSLFMKKLNLAYFHYYHVHYGWVGHFWQDRFKSQPVGKDAYFIQCGKYIELNPVRARLVEFPQDYHFSSYRHYVFGEPNDLITDDFVFQTLGNSDAERRAMYHTMVINDLVVASYSKKTWGSAKERYNESRKISYHLRARANLSKACLFENRPLVS